MMNLQYHRSESTVKPPELDTTSSKYSVYLRKNFKEIYVKQDPMDEESPEQLMYVYEEAVISKEDYKLYESECENSDEHDDMDLAITELAETTDEQNTDNMLALADLAEEQETLDTDSSLAITEAYEDLAAQIAALEARITALEG